MCSVIGQDEYPLSWKMSCLNASLHGIPWQQVMVRESGSSQQVRYVGVTRLLNPDGSGSAYLT